MSQTKNISEIRREYGHLSLEESGLNPCPLKQFELWFEEVLTQEKNDPTAMVLSTVDEQGHPDARVVLLKGLIDGHFIFFTNYQSPKSKQLSSSPYAALTFFWPEMARQVRIRGRVERIPESQSDEYFSSRPFKSQVSAIVSPQSQIIESRKVLEDKIHQILSEASPETIARPEYWGGFQVIPQEVEFWQGRDNRLHDRILYVFHDSLWIPKRLAP